jgi:hypothetical protein
MDLHTFDCMPFIHGCFNAEPDHFGQFPAVEGWDSMPPVPRVPFEVCLGTFAFSDPKDSSSEQPSWVNEPKYSSPPPSTPSTASPASIFAYMPSPVSSVITSPPASDLSLSPPKCSPYLTNETIASPETMTTPEDGRPDTQVSLYRASADGARYSPKRKRAPIPDSSATISPLLELDIKLEPNDDEESTNDLDVQTHRFSRRSSRLTHGAQVKGRQKRRRAQVDGAKSSLSCSRAYCNLCDLSFGRVYDWRRHNDSVHNNTFPFPCQFCGQRFKRSDARKRHMDPYKEHGRSCCPRRTLLFESIAANSDPDLIFETVLKSGLKCVNIVTCGCAAELPVP